MHLKATRLAYGFVYNCSFPRKNGKLIYFAGFSWNTICLYNFGVILLRFRLLKLYVICPF